MWGLTTQAVVNQARRVVRKVVSEVTNFQKVGPRKERFSLPSAVTPFQSQQNLVARFTSRNVYPRLVQRMRNKYGGNLTSGSAQVFGNFHGLRGKVAFGFIAGFAFNQMQTQDDISENVCSDIRNLFVKVECEVVSCEVGLDNYELGSCLSAKKGAIVYEARLKSQTEDLDDDITFLETETTASEGASVMEDSFSFLEDSCDSLTSIQDVDVESYSGDTSDDIVPMSCKQTNPTAIFQPKENITSENGQNEEIRKNLEVAVNQMNDSFHLITEDEAEIPPLEFNPTLFDLESYSSLFSSFSCESHLDSIAPMYFSIRSEVAMDCVSEASDIEVLDQWEEEWSDDADLTQETMGALKISPMATPPCETTPAPHYDLAVKILTPSMNGVEQGKQGPLSNQGVQASGVPAVDVPSHPNIVQVRGRFVERAGWMSWSRMVDHADMLPSRLGTGHNQVTVTVMNRYPCSLPVYLSSHSLTPHSACLIITQLLEVVLHLHDAGLTHRSLSSADLLLDFDDRGEPVLMDCSRYKKIESLADVEQTMYDVGRVASELLDVGGTNPGQLSDDLPSGLSHIIRGLLHREVERPSPRIILTALHLLLWEPHQLGVHRKVMSMLLNMAACVIMTSRGHQTNDVTYNLQTMMLSRLTPDDVHDALNLLNGRFL